MDLQSLVTEAEKFFPGLSRREVELLEKCLDGRAMGYATVESGDIVVRSDLLRWICTDGRIASAIGRRGLELERARITGGLDLDYCAVGFPVDFRQCSFEGTISLNYAELRSLTFSGGRADGFSAQAARIKGDLFLSNGFTVRGETKLTASDISGNLVCTGGSFDGNGAKAFNGNRMTVGGSVYLDQGFGARGEVQLIDAQIGGNLSCSGARILNKDHDALSGDRTVIDGSVYFRDKFSTDGMIRFPGARIKGQLSFEGSIFLTGGRSGLFAQNLRVEEAFFWRDLSITPETEIDLSHAYVGQLCDDSAGWPAPGGLLLDGFEYKSIADVSPHDASSRSDWLRRQPDNSFRPQPFEQLAAVLRREGHEDEARTILIEKQRSRIELGNLSAWSAAWNRLLGVTLGFGYKPQRVLIFIVLFLILGTVLFGAGYSNDVMAPVKERVFMDPAYLLDREIPEPYPVFNAFMYSLDSFLPIVDLHQESFWLPNANRGGWGVFLVWYLRVHIVVGWVLTSLAILGFSGLVRKD